MAMLSSLLLYLDDIQRNKKINFTEVMLEKLIKKNLSLYLEKEYVSKEKAFVVVVEWV